MCPSTETPPEQNAEETDGKAGSLLITSLTGSFNGQKQAEAGNTCAYRIHGETYEQLTFEIGECLR